MALKLKEFDFKGFLLQKGERVGLYAAGGLALLMVILSLFLPGKGLLSPSPKTSANEMTKLAGDKKTAVVNAKPTESESEDLRRVPTELQKQASSVAEDPGEYRFAGELFAPREIPSNKRQNPNIYAPEEFLGKVVMAQVSKYMMITERDGGVRFGVLSSTDRNLKGQNAFDRLNGMFGKGGGNKPGAPGAPGGGMGGSGAMGGSGDSRNRGGRGSFGPGSPGAPGGGAFGEDKNVEIKYVKKDELASVPNAVFARDLLPLPMAEVVGSFPLKAQIEEHKTALHADSAYNVVFQETVGEKDKPRRAFEFLGFDVQRKTYGPDGKVVKGLEDNEWQPLDLTGPNSAYIATVTQVLKEFAKEDPKIAPLMVQGLYLPRPVQIPIKEGQTAVAKEYPKIEEDLPKIKETLAKMKDKEQAPAVPPSKFDEAAGFNPFGDPDADKAGPNDGKNVPTASEWSPPDYCVLRFLDLTIQPGQSYEYRLRVKMRNPNWNKPEGEVANKQLTVKPELESEWKPVTKPDGQMLRISVQPDLYLYCVDQQEVDNRGQTKKVYKGMHANASYDASRQVPVQIHKWMDQYELRNRKPTAFFPVGEWVVGERVFATRGELVGVKEAPTHVPVWSPEHSSFTLAGRPPARAGRGADTRPTADVGFLEARKAPLLVDFDGGSVTYRHAAAPPPRNDDGSPGEAVKSAAPLTEVKGVAGTEILLLTPDGKLLGRAAARDEEDDTRKEREKEYAKRVEDAESKEAPATGGKTDPFGGGGGKP